MEGYKIGTSEYYGLRNIGFIFVSMIFLFSTVIYPVFLWPLSWVVGKITNPFIGRVLILILSGIGGYALFYKAYDERFIREYDLNSITAIIFFSIAGIIYILVDYFLERRVNKG
ncbi:hypothetical protein [Paenibacillus sp. sgz302251]|uniref:hypothetical protein n=1 Tax=Paenibacillus sp. sgz302251 TaxID=3414493 RepID=UPI003C7C520A